MAPTAMPPLFFFIALITTLGCRSVFAYLLSSHATCKRQEGDALPQVHPETSPGPRTVPGKQQAFGKSLWNQG